MMTGMCDILNMSTKKGEV